ncbi:PIN domain-containing protein [Allosaccharopolyspora coralli]|uniref:PIN domain-containing protein n=1 Tax=Allosaccharopolyspora coralli TaxID=2665642 RepID=A0A5Q3Q238_9PSEU|nr:type II toxin-antitoxin system VapC family toxin [Allosaccharopolyspora coralli]QGK68542.1 PIN domain-containing protein [Allosaccharopolyspora coralli]
MSVVFDASALMAWIYSEPGADVVAESLADESTTISAVNWSEVLQKIDARGGDADQLGERILALGVSVAAFDSAEARAAARLYPATRTAGLSLGDRACLALAQRLDHTALTADTAWTRIPKTTGVTVELIRDPHHRSAAGV